MDARYKQPGVVSLKLFRPISEVVCAMYPTDDQLREFVERNFGLETVQSFGWNTGLVFIVQDLLRHLNSRCKIGRLMELLQQAQPEHAKLQDLIKGMLDAGYLIDTTSTTTQRQLNPKGIDWVGKYAIRLNPLDKPIRDALIDELASCFTSAGDLDRFVRGNFNSQFHVIVCQKMTSTLPVRSAVEAVFGEFERIGWLAAFLASVEGGYADKDLPFLSLVCGQFNKPAVPKPAPAPAPAKPAPAPAKPASTAYSYGGTRQAPETVYLSAMLKDLTPALKEELRKLFLAAFTSYSDYQQLCLFDLDIRLNSIVGESCTTVQLIVALMEWASEEERIHDLINAYLKRREWRTDIREFVQKLIAEGYAQARS